METRGIYMSPDRAEAAKYADSLVKVTDQISAVIGDWQRSVRNNDALAFSNFAVRITGYQDALYKLAPLAKQSGPQAAREWAEKNLPAQIRAELSKDLEKLSQHYSDRRVKIYTQIDEGIDRTAMLLSVLACFAVMLAIAGALTIARSVTKPITEITNVTQAVAAGDGSIAIPFSDRPTKSARWRARSACFRTPCAAMRNSIVPCAATPISRARRQEQMSSEISHFSAEVEATLAELGRISDRDAGGIDPARGRRGQRLEQDGARRRSLVGSLRNVRDIASAADELSASVNEIDRQVAQSNAIANQSGE